MRIFIGLNNIAGYYGPLAEGLRSLGHQVSSVFLYQSIFQYADGSSSSYIAKLFTICGNQRMRYQRKQFLQKAFWKISQEILRVPLCVWAICRHDAFILSFGGSIIPGDLALMRLLGKRVVMVYHGSDNRPPFVDGFQIQRFSKNVSNAWKNIIRRYAIKTQKIEQKVSHVVCLPASGSFLSMPAYSFLSLGIPSKPVEYVQYPCEDIAVVKILHSPSNPEAKGTPLIRRIIHELKEEGLNFEFVEITGVPNATVLEEILKCHFVIDQAYSDTPLAGFAAEAASLGRVAVVGSFNCVESNTMHRNGAHPPSVFVHPQLMKDRIRQLVLNPRLAKQLGQNMHDFIRDHWEYRLVAQRYESILMGSGCKSWMFDPSAISSPGCAGGDEVCFAELISDLVSTFGDGVLMADHNVVWKNNLLKLANESRLPERII